MKVHEEDKNSNLPVAAQQPGIAMGFMTTANVDGDFVVYGIPQEVQGGDEAIYYETLALEVKGNTRLEAADQLDNLKTSIAKMKNEAEAITVENDKEMDTASGFLLEIKPIYKNIEKEKDKIIKPMNEFTKKLRKFFADFMSPLETAEIGIKGKIATYVTEKERKQQAEQSRLAEEARKAEERRKKELLKQAEKHMDKGNLEKAQERIEESQKTFVSTTITPEAKRASRSESGGLVSTQNDIEVTVLDKQKLVAWIANQPNIDKYVSIKLGALKAYIKATGVNIPGVSHKNIKTVSVRA
ncbi:MAG: hypothetical protein KAW12_07080 [Candidatus Aminicenantes bacterium]|nr:hypothetical protein [Candidatus Aminicenantes bacterium]